MVNKFILNYTVNSSDCRRQQPLQQLVHVYILAHGVIETLLVAIPNGTFDNCIGFTWNREHK